MRSVVAIAASVATCASAVSARRDYSDSDELSLRTQALMWPAYGLGAVVIARDLIEARRSAPHGGKVIGVTLAAAGASTLLLGARWFRSFANLAGRGTEDLITDGIYRYSRNPQYVGNVALAAGAALAARSMPGATFAGVGAAAYRFYVPAEEAHLERVFGPDYERYRAATPRWVRTSYRGPLGNFSGRLAGSRTRQ